MAQRRAQIVGQVLETARTLHGKHEMFQDSETSLKGTKTKILIFGFRHMITMRDLDKLRGVVEEENARIDSLGVLPEKIGPTKKYTGVIEMIFSLLPERSQPKPAVKRGLDLDDEEECEDSNCDRTKRRQPFFGQREKVEEGDDSPSLFSRLGSR